MSRYIDADTLKIPSEEMVAKMIINSAPSIDLADYVPKDFHDKTCEAMAKAHQKEIADMVRVVRCKECASYCGDGNKCLWGLLTGDMGYCHHGYRGGDCITKQTEPQTDCSWK